MPRYQSLETYLRNRQAEEVPVTFEEIEAIIGTKLPSSAHDHRAWWSNNASNNVMTKSWLAAGYHTERVDMAERKLVFRRMKEGSPPRKARTATPPPRGSHERKSILEALWGSLAGTVHVPDGVDLTEPMNEIWDAERQ